MKLISELTEGQFRKLLDEYFAVPEKRSKMTSEEIKDLAQRVNKRINVPLIRETKEEKILIKVIIKIDRFLYDNLPNEFYDLVRSLDGGIDDDEAKRLVKRLAKLANEKINIPYLPEKAEYLAIRLVIGVIINAARKSWNINKAAENANNMYIPENRDANDTDLEKMIA